MLVQNVPGSLQYKLGRKFWVRIPEGAAYFQPYGIPNQVYWAQVRKIIDDEILHELFPQKSDNYIG